MKGVYLMTKNIENMRDEVQALEGPVLSIYLNTRPESEDWKILLKNGLKKTHEYVATSNPEDEQQFSQIAKNADKKIKDNQLDFTNSLICFASEDHIHLYFLQVSVNNDFQWDKRPALEQLNQLYDKYPKSGVVLLQRDKITLITTILGEFIKETHYELDIDKEDWTQYKGLAFGNVYASSANHRDKYDRRIKENQDRWYKNIVPTIEKHARIQGWKSCHLAGPTELTKEMKNLLNIKISGETTRNYSGKSAHAILNRTILSSDE